MRLLRAWLRTECFNFLISSKSFLDAQSKASILSEIFLNSRNEAHLARVSIFVHLVTDHIFIHPFILYRLILFYFISFHSILFIIFYRRSAFFYFLFFHLFCDNLPCSGMFWNIPGCSGMFHVPGFVDAPWFVFARQQNINRKYFYTWRSCLLFKTVQINFLKTGVL